MLSLKLAARGQRIKDGKLDPTGAPNASLVAHATTNNTEAAEMLVPVGTHVPCVRPTPAAQTVLTSLKAGGSLYVIRELSSRCRPKVACTALTVARALCLRLFETASAPLCRTAEARQGHGA